MSSEDYDEFDKVFCGTWKFDHMENMKSWMEAAGKLFIIYENASKILHVPFSVFVETLTLSVDYAWVLLCMFVSLGIFEHVFIFIATGASPVHEAEAALDSTVPVDPCLCSMTRVWECSFS